MKFRYFCQICEVWNDTKKDAFNHTKHPTHKKNVMEMVVGDENNTENDRMRYTKMFTTNEEDMQRDLFYGQFKKFDDVTKEGKIYFFCKYCSREFVKQNNLVNHIQNTCKKKKDQDIFDAQMEKIMTEETQDDKKEHIGQLGNKLGMDDMFEDNNDLKQPIKDDNYTNDSEEEDILGVKEEEEEAFPHHDKDKEAEEFAEFTRIIQFAAMQGLNEQEQMQYVYQYQKKKRQEQINEIKYYYMMIRREEERERITNAQKVSIHCANEAREILKKITEQVSTLALLNKGTINLTEKEMEEEHYKNVEKMNEYHERFRLRRKNKYRNEVLLGKNYVPYPENDNDNNDENNQADTENEANNTDEPMCIPVPKLKKSNRKKKPINAEDIDSKEFLDQIYKNNVTEEEELYEEIRLMYLENHQIFNQFVRDNYIKFMHIFTELI